MYLCTVGWIPLLSLFCGAFRETEREREEKQILFTAKSLTPKHQRQREGERERGETDVRREGYALYPGNDGGEREGGMERDREMER